MKKNKSKILDKSDLSKIKGGEDVKNLLSTINNDSEYGISCLFSACKAACKPGCMNECVSGKCCADTN